MRSFRILVVGILFILTGCATFKNTPQQDYVWEKGRICDAQVAFWKMERVEANGRYWIRGATNAPPGKDDYFACLQAQFAKNPYREWVSQHWNSSPDTRSTPPITGVTSPPSGRTQASSDAATSAARTTTNEVAPKPQWVIGDEWSYRWESPRGKGTFVWVVERFETIEGIDSVVIKSGDRETFYRREDGALHLQKIGDIVEVRHRPPMTIVRWPAELGKKWTTAYIRENVRARQTDDMILDCTIDAVDSVTVPAGSFRAFHTVCLNQRSGSLNYEFWYAPEVGNMVKDRSNLSYGIRERELIGFKRAAN